MSRFSAWFDCGETDERAPEWLVVEYIFDDGQGNRVGEIVESAADEADANRIAALLNTAAEHETFHNQECEFG